MWLNAVSLLWLSSQDPDLREMIRWIAKGPAATQGDDAYVGTHVPDERFRFYRGADKNVWARMVVT